MYYLFISNKPIDMTTFELTLNSVIEDEFDFVVYDAYSGHIETGFSISTFLKHQLTLINSDLGQSIKILGTPKLDDLSMYLLKHILKMNSPYHSLADAITISLIQNDEATKQLFLHYFDHVNKELIDSILSFVEHGSNVLLVSKLLYIHRNTMNQRISKFTDITNLDMRDVEHNQLVYLYRLLKDNTNLF
ncbi:MAG: helix-turn-helix domain-containing protein [Erysipelotrichales bacterium]|nr:helix-turn-helix domain-containing protein [Erysipelotrichales bacterium]